MKKMTSKSKKFLWLGLGALVILPTVIIVPIVVLNHGHTNDPYVKRPLTPDLSRILFSERGAWFGKTELIANDFLEQGITETQSFSLNNINLKKITIPSTIKIGHSTFRSSDALEIFIPDAKMDIEWADPLDGQYDMFTNTPKDLVVHMPLRYIDNGTARKFGLTEFQFGNIHWHGIHDPNNPDPVE